MNAIFDDMKSVQVLFLAGVSFFLMLASCEHNEQSKKQIPAPDYYPKRVVTDTIVPDRYHVFEEYLDSTHYLVGVETRNGIVFMRDTNEIHKPHTWGLNSYSRDFVVFRQGHGSDDHTSVIVDLNTGIAKEYYMEFKYNLKDSLVCYWPYPWPTNKVTVENFVTSKKDSLVFKKNCTSALIHYCFDIDSLSGNTIYYQWDPEASYETEVLKTNLKLQ